MQLFNMFVRRVQETAKGGVGAGVAYIKERATASICGADQILDQRRAANGATRQEDKTDGGGEKQCAPC